MDVCVMQYIKPNAIHCYILPRLTSSILAVSSLGPRLLSKCSGESATLCRGNLEQQEIHMVRMFELEE